MHRQEVLEQDSNSSPLLLEYENHLALPEPAFRCDGDSQTGRRWGQMRSQKQIRRRWWGRGRPQSASSCTGHCSKWERPTRLASHLPLPLLPGSPCWGRSGPGSVLPVPRGAGKASRRTRSPELKVRGSSQSPFSELCGVIYTEGLVSDTNYPHHCPSLIARFFLFCTILCLIFAFLFHVP